VPVYFLQIGQGRYSGVADSGIEVADRDAAWMEMTKVFGDLAGGVSRDLKQNAEWQMELLDEFKTPVLRIRLIAETVV